ncbi:MULTISPECIES: AzlD domain-containing protein [unclassified Moraxella]|uniref:AzlD domain-containing protein n=1 Tax=unclassified Moraxella TaxID=2685852 RepID=UPI003AF64B43
MITNSYLVIGVLVMAGVTMATRFMPVMLPKRWLNSPLLLAVNKGLPLTVMSLLILTSLQWLDKEQHLAISPLLLSQILALGVVLVSYHIWRQLFVSMVIGIACVNGFLYLLS